MTRQWASTTVVLSAFAGFVFALSPSIGSGTLNLFRISENAYLQLIGKRLPPNWEREFSTIAKDKKLLVVSEKHPFNHPAMYFSLLKLRALLSREELGVNEMKFKIHENTRALPSNSISRH